MRKTDSIPVPRDEVRTLDESLPRLCKARCPSSGCWLRPTAETRNSVPMPVGWDPGGGFNDEGRKIVEELRAKEAIGIGIVEVLVELSAFTIIVHWQLARAEAGWLEKQGASEAENRAAEDRAEQHWSDPTNG